MSGYNPTSITILGATGSIGLNTLDVIARHPDRFAVFALTAHQQIDRLAELCIRFQPAYAVVASAAQASVLRIQLQAATVKTEVLFGEQALCDVAQASETDAVMAAIVGAAGLKPALAAAKAGKTIYLANKETLVVAGALFMQTVQQNGARLLPVDSEHNAIFQALPADYQGDLEQAGVTSLILTASGGPFLHTALADFAAITPEAAIRHPNWQMGRKISVDSASMMNKGLELIEARWLFNAAADQLEVVIHPQSVIHSMVRYIDGSVLAQMGEPDMRIPIAHCLGLPDRIDSGVKQLDFTRLSGLNFLAPDFERFPCLKLAYEVLHSGHVASSCVLNAANEIAVAAFLDGFIRFTDLASIVDSCLQHFSGQSASSIEELLLLDTQVRSVAKTWVASRAAR
ncbi:1-deoxy-D-xylulose-5-phosphate reductoisomerase [Snodgrassella alvi]|jgi:1-deoxy-D-xylulose-5-phosphate reductoisomerase|uniref:1-deoxy-D-xylulose 5-phosphate reductoisomerase n=1 Tax=Snodgrassella alvi TaxID=1196083 RepID=A0A855FXN6_9NEIS|nr:1-deoxy-D-xylulose-5-phosphate reductoisomerase [Snodgrassella alvi]PIT12932.1 1-deoxy-D-xylulose-5-phosphate reductoisomerase [Snodgrassella alvi]PIT24137.1 1-deoxy-D-xylulose-5-phosphate reductoisomerase [Snodgrassella alvi]PIT59152.1 1-deoxy-D-xylulose-5-phosphate reductoisomerase [Snodgrassella alvi]PIT60284.1 1-deoxy-D-xylulose-5-phosphate reductoisomerase [Snodgrassella alvi]